MRKKFKTFIRKIEKCEFQNNMVMEILKNATEVKQEEPKEVKQEKKTISNNESGSNGKKS